MDDQYGGTLYVISDQSNLYFLFWLLIVSATTSNHIHYPPQPSHSFSAYSKIECCSVQCMCTSQYLCYLCWFFLFCQKHTFICIIYLAQDKDRLFVLITLKPFSPLIAGIVSGQGGSLGAGEGAAEEQTQPRGDFDFDQRSQSLLPSKTVIRLIVSLHFLYQCVGCKRAQ